MAVQPVPEGFHTLTPYLAVDDAATAIDFYKQAFGAEEQVRMPTDDGKIAHAQLRIGDTPLMLSDPMEQSSVRPPKEVDTSTASIFMYVEDVDATVQKAVEAGATVSMEVQDAFWGDRWGTITDPFGHLWSVATHVEDVPEEEMAERAKNAMAEMG
jgi:PhnB protein